MAYLEPVLACRGPVLACLGLVLACLGPVLGLSGACLGLSGPVLGLSWPVLDVSGARLGLSWPVWARLGPVWTCGGPVLGRFWTLCCNCCHNPAGTHFLLFITTLQRGGTCAAHPPPPEGMPCVPDINAFILSVPASKFNASELGFRFLPPRSSPILLFLPPDPHIPPSRPKN